MSVEIEVFSTTGALVQRLEWANVISTNGTVDNLNLTDSSLNGGKLIPGAYLYRANVISHPGTNQEQHFESKFGKLIVVN